MTSVLPDADATPDDAQARVVAYLTQDPGFFERHPELLEALVLPHSRSGSAVSLIERQVEVLRDKNQSLEARLNSLVNVARANEVLVGKIHRLTRRLLATTDRQSVINQLRQSLTEDFQLPDSALLLFGLGAVDLAIDRFVGVIDAKDPGLASFESLLSHGKPRCGPIREAHRDFLFGSEGSHIQSAALLPLGGAQPFGLLAIGSPSAEHFNPGMSTEFLANIADLASDALARD
jgi:uncharacterized protein YigA (DUF484 family)